MEQAVMTAAGTSCCWRDPTPPDVTRGEVQLPPRVQVTCCHRHVPEVRCRDSQRRMEAATCLQVKMDAAYRIEEDMLEHSLAWGGRV